MTEATHIPMDWMILDRPLRTETTYILPFFSLVKGIKFVTICACPQLNYEFSFQCTYGACPQLNYEFSMDSMGLCALFGDGTLALKKGSVPNFIP